MGGWLEAKGNGVGLLKDGTTKLIQDKINWDRAKIGGRREPGHTQDGPMQWPSNGVNLLRGFEGLT